MIPCPSEWSQHRSGPRLVLLPPPRLAGIRVFYRERQSPLQPLAALVEATLAGDAGFVRVVGSFLSSGTSSAQRLVTAEGEYAAVMELRGHAAGDPNRTPVQRSVGAIFAEDFCTWLDVVCVRPELFAESQQLGRLLLRDDELLLGVRRRRFYFTPPAGWHGISDGLIARFYAPGYPREQTVLTVWPAQPLGTPGVGWHEGMVRGALPTGDLSTFGPLAAEPEVLDGPHRLTSTQGQPGLYSRLRLGNRQRSAIPISRTLVTFADRTYGYAMCADSPESAASERSQQVLLAAASSIQLLPGKQVAGPPTRSDQVLKMWGF